MKFIHSFFLFILLSCTTHLHLDGKESNYKWDFAVVTIFRDEAPYLKEWIEFHKLVGAQHFYLYNNLSSDDYLTVLEPYIKKGEVELFECPYVHNNADEFNAIATRAFEDAHQRAKGKVKWLAMLDSDEFLYVVDGRKIQDYLEPLMKTKIGGVLVHWYMFGTSNVPFVPKDKLMIEMLTLTGGKHELYKTIYRPEKVKRVVNQHYCEYKSGYKHHENIQDKFGDIRINHYWARDEFFFNNIKIPRRILYGTPQETSELWNSLMNDHPDDAIAPYIKPLRKKMGLD
jgi:hypothetical protein